VVPLGTGPQWSRPGPPPSLSLYSHRDRPPSPPLRDAPRGGKKGGSDRPRSLQYPPVPSNTLESGIAIGCPTARATPAYDSPVLTRDGISVRLSAGGRHEHSQMAFETQDDPFPARDGHMYVGSHDCPAPGGRGSRWLRRLAVPATVRARRVREPVPAVPPLRGGGDRGTGPAAPRDRSGPPHSCKRRHQKGGCRQGHMDRSRHPQQGIGPPSPPRSGCGNRNGS